MLTRKNDAALDFDFAKVTGAVQGQPGLLRPVRQRAGPFRPAPRGEAGIDVDRSALPAADLSHLAHPAELELARKVAEWPRLVEHAAPAHEPHRVAFFLYDIASDLHSLWNRGNDDPSLRFVQEGDAGHSPSKNRAGAGGWRCYFKLVSLSLASLRSKKCADHNAPPPDVGAGSQVQSGSTGRQADMAVMDFREGGYVFSRHKVKREFSYDQAGRGQPPRRRERRISGGRRSRARLPAPGSRG